MDIARRRLITGLASFIAAPAIVRAASIMPVKVPPVAAQPAVVIDVGNGAVLTGFPLSDELLALLRSRIRDAQVVMREAMVFDIWKNPTGACSDGLGALR